MKVLICSLVSLISVLGSSSFADASPEVSTAVEVKSVPKNYNLIFDPVSVVRGVLSGGIQLGVSNAFTLGVNVRYSNQYGEQYKTANEVAYTTVTAGNSSLGLRMSYYFNGQRLADGWHLGLSVDRHFIHYRIFSWNSDAGTFSDNSMIRSSLLGTSVGYHWVWRSGFNVILNGGLVFPLSSSHILVNREQVDLLDLSLPKRFNLELRMGYLL